MSTTQLTPVTGSFDNREDWDAVTQRITQVTGMPLTVSPDDLLAMISSGVALMFEAQTSANANLLRGTLAAPVVAQCRVNIDGLLSGRPQSVVVHLAAGRVVDGRGVVRAHLEIHGVHPDGTPSIDRHFWDLQLGAEVTVAQTTCPNCGAPVAGGELVCTHCGTDVRTVTPVPAVVTRLELY
jgi:hypothetical protein